MNANHQKCEVYYSEDEEFGWEARIEKEENSSTDLYHPKETNLSKSKKEPKKMGKKIQKQRIRDKGERKDKNTFGNMLDKLYRVALKELHFKREIQAGKMGNDVKVVTKKKTKQEVLSNGKISDKETIEVLTENKCAKSVMQKFLLKIRMGFDSLEKEVIEERFMASVEKSINFQLSQQAKHPNYVAACQETIATLKTIKKLIHDCLSGSEIKIDELTSLVFASQKGEHYNNGVKEIQKIKIEKHQRELESVQPVIPSRRTVNLLLNPEVERLMGRMEREESLFDVLSEHQVSDWPFEEWFNDIESLK